MLVILSPFLALAILVSIKTAGIRDNEVLLLLLTLSSAVLSGINGFGRRTATAVQLSSGETHAPATILPRSASRWPLSKQQRLIESKKEQQND